MKWNTWPLVCDTLLSEFDAFCFCCFCWRLEVGCRGEHMSHVSDPDLEVTYPLLTYDPPRHHRSARRVRITMNLSR